MEELKRLQQYEQAYSVFMDEYDWFTDEMKTRITRKLIDIGLWDDDE